MRKPKLLKAMIRLIVFALIAESISACIASNNTNATEREILAECQLPEASAIVRLYKSNGSSATTSDSWIITYQEPDAKEITIFSAYSSPAIKNMQCEQSQIALVKYADDNPTIVLSQAWIKSELTRQPLTFYKSKLTSPEYKDEVADWEGIVIP